MLITSARRSVNTDHVAEAAFFEGIKACSVPNESWREIECKVIELTYASGKVGYYAANLNIVILVNKNWISCHCDPLLFADLLANFFSQ